MRELHIFPEEHLLGLTRDGRDVVHSTVKTWPQILFPFAAAAAAGARR